MSGLSMEMIEKPPDLTLEECQEAFAMFRIQRKIQQAMELIMTNPGFYHIRNQIFGYLNNETIENCRKVSMVWNESLEKMALIKFLLEFGNTVIDWTIDDEGIVTGDTELSTIIPSWNKAANIHGAKSSIEDLQEIKDSLGKLLVENGKCCIYPVHQAAENGNVKLMEFFLSTSYDMNSQDSCERTVFHLACANEATAQLLIELSTILGIDLNAIDIYGRTPSHHACSNGTTETVKLLAELGIAFNTRDEDGETPFHKACAFGRTETVKLLIELSTKLGIDVNAINIIGETAFHKACESSSTSETVKLLIDSSIKLGIDLNARKNHGATPFHFACVTDRTDTVKLLIDSSTKFGIDLNAKDHFGDTPLHWAYDGSVLKILFENWNEFGIIDIKIRNNAGKTALELLQDHQDLEGFTMDCEKESHESIVRRFLSLQNESKIDDSVPN